MNNARLELVLTIPCGPMAPKGEADRGGSTGASRQGSIGEKVAEDEDRGSDFEPGAGLNADALALSFGDVAGDSALSETALVGTASRAKEDMVRCMVGVGGPETVTGMTGDCGRPRGVRARKDGTRAGA